MPSRLSRLQKWREHQPVPPLLLLGHLLNLTGHYQLDPYLQDPHHQIRFPTLRKLLNNFPRISKLQARSGSRGCCPQKFQHLRGRHPATLCLGRSPRKCMMLGEYAANAVLLNFSHCLSKSGQTSFSFMQSCALCAGGFFFAFLRIPRLS